MGTIYVFFLLPYLPHILLLFFSIVFLEWLAEKLGMRKYGRLVAPLAALVGLILAAAGVRWGVAILLVGLLVTAATMAVGDYHPDKEKKSKSTAK